MTTTDMNTTALEKSRPCLLSDSFKAVKSFGALPILITGMSRNQVQTFSHSESRSLIRMMQELSVWSLDSFIMMEKDHVCQYLPKIMRCQSYLDDSCCLCTAISKLLSESRIGKHHGEELRGIVTQQEC